MNALNYDIFLEYVFWNTQTHFNSQIQIVSAYLVFIYIQWMLNLFGGGPKIDAW